MKRIWFKNRNWEDIVWLNEGLCQKGNALHKPNPEGYEETKTFWTARSQDELTLGEAVEICRQCHRLAPFCFYNGNTFVAIIRDCISHAPGLSPPQVAVARSLAGHMVAGTAEPEEISQFNELLRDIELGIDSFAGLTPGSYQIGDRVQTPKGTLTGTIVGIADNGSILWRCDQTGAQMTGTPQSLLAFAPKL